MLPNKLFKASKREPNQNVVLLWSKICYNLHVLLQLQKCVKLVGWEYGLWLIESHLMRINVLMWMNTGELCCVCPLASVNINGECYRA